jgi:transcriptional regulator with XRE-family HTH domain
MNIEQTTYSAVLGVVLANIRKRKGVDQKEMADRMGLSQASYSRLEGGKSAFSVDQMFQAATALGLSGDELNRQLNATIMHLETNGISVVPQLRGSTTQAKDEAVGLGHVIVGAALGALLIGLLSKK